MSSPRGAIVRAAMQSLCATKRCSSRIPSRSQNDTAAGIGLKDTYCTSYSTKRQAAVKFDHHQLSKRNKRTLYIFLSFKSLLGEKGRTCSLCFMSKGTTFSKRSGQQAGQLLHPVWGPCQTQLWSPFQPAKTPGRISSTSINSISFNACPSIRRIIWWRCIHSSPNRRTVCRKLGGFWEMSKIKTSWVHWHRTDQLGWGVHGVRATSGFSELSHRTPPEVPISALSWRERASGVASIENILRLIHAKKNKEKRRENDWK